MVEALLRAPNARVTWLCALFLLGYVGVEVALGGWIVKFMLEVRKGGDFASGMTATGFWMGITVGRIVLGFITPKLGEKLAIAVGLRAGPSGNLLSISRKLSCYATVLTNIPRSTCPSQWPSNLSSGSCLNSTFQQSLCPCRVSSLDLSSRLPSLPLQSSCLSTYTSALSDSRLPLAAVVLRSSHSRSVRSRSPRVCRCCSPSFWPCWVLSWDFGCVCPESIRSRSKRGIKADRRGSRAE
jgi:hypothetical protein